MPYRKIAGVETRESGEKDGFGPAEVWGQIPNVFVTKSGSFGAWRFGGGGAARLWLATAPDLLSASTLVPSICSSRPLRAI